MYNPDAESETGATFAQQTNNPFCKCNLEFFRFFDLISATLIYVCVCMDV